MNTSSNSPSRSRRRPGIKSAFMRKGGVLALVLAILCQTCWAQTNGNIHDWKNLQALESGSGIWLQTMQGRKLHGELVQVTDKALWINSDECRFFGRRMVQRVIPRESVREVRRFSQAVPQVVGTLIGAGAGAGIGAAIDASAKNEGEDPHIGLLIFSLLGLVVGGAVSERATFIKGRTIYKSQ